MLFSPILSNGTWFMLRVLVARGWRNDTYATFIFHGKPKRKVTSIQAADNKLEKRSKMVYGVLESKAEVAADRVRHDIEWPESYFKWAPAKGESITLC